MQQMLLWSAMNRKKLWRGSSTLSGCYSCSQANNMLDIMSLAMNENTIGWHWSFPIKGNFTVKKSNWTDVMLLYWLYCSKNCESYHYNYYLGCLVSVFLSKHPVHWIQVDILVILFSFTRQLGVSTSNHHSICRAGHAWTNYW